jgi:hypothetical protein
LDVQVRFDEKDATVRYLPAKVTLEQILRRYDDTPFGVIPSGPVVTIARTTHGKVRVWTERTPAVPGGAKSDSDRDAPTPIRMFLEYSAKGTGSSASVPELSLADPPAAGLAQLEAFKQVADVASVSDGSASTRYLAKLYETVALPPGEVIVPVTLVIKTKEQGDNEASLTTRLEVVLRTTREAASNSTPATTGVALIDGTLDLKLGHLCDQRGCVQHFHQSLKEISGLAAINPHPSLENPGATAYLRAGQPIDLWSLREDLRDQSIEVAGIVPRDLDDFRLRIELPRWHLSGSHAHTASADDSHGTEKQTAARHHDSTDQVQQCLVCRERIITMLGKLTWAKEIAVAGGGINFRPQDSSIDLTRLLDMITDNGVAPSAVWLLPAGVPMPKAAPPRDVHFHADPQVVGSQAHPVIEFDLAHTCDVGSGVMSLLHQQKWASETRIDVGQVTLVRASIADRRFANLTPLLMGFRSAGQTPREIRLRNFGDLHIQLEFAHICGDIVYSKPPKPKKKKNDEKKDKGETKNDDEKKAEKPKKPFVPQPVSMATTSNGRKAIEAAVNSVDWIKDGLFYDYHTKLEFRGGPRKMSFAMQTSGDDVVRLDALLDALRVAGFPPKSVIVSRRFPGIPFGKPLPADLKLKDRDGQQQTLASFKKPGRPLAVAFVCLKTKSRKYGKYEADPKLYERLGKTIEAYKDRVDFVAFSANEHDTFADVAEFWDQTKLTIPLLHDADGAARDVFNMQITPAPHIYLFDAEGLLRYGGDAHSNWEKPDDEHDDYLAQALDLVFAGKYLKNGAVFYNKSLCNCSHPKCKCPKCGCGASCRCGIKHCSVGF